MKRWLWILGFLGACAQTPEAPTDDGFEAYEDGPPLVTADGKGDELAEDIPAYSPLPSWADLDMELEAMFAPDDPVNTAEMALIARVVEERRQDAREFVEGENPFRIRYAVYNLRNPRIVEALADAEDAGVDVQVLIEAHQLDPAKDFNVADERLIERGFEFVADHRDLEGDQFVTADLIGIEGSGLMHLKTRLFETPSERVVLSGSLNPGDNAMLNEETLHLIRIPHLVEAYAAAYDAVLSGRRPTNDWRDDEPVNVMFTPSSGDRAVGRVFDWLAEEDEQILLMVFSLRDLRAPGHDRTLVELLADKVADGVPVWVITDRKQSDGVDAAGNRMTSNDGTEDRLRRAGVHVYEATNRATDFTAMHHKVAILGRTNIRVITDAANWTFSGLGSDTRVARNIESQLFIDSGRYDGNRVGKRYMAQWMRVLRRYASQSAGDGEPAFETGWQELSSAPGWPGQSVAFTAFDGFTQFGESVFVRGDIDALGRWGEIGAGQELHTDEATFPTWTSTELATMRVGEPFEWKFVIGVPGATNVRWEAGENREGLGQPAVLDETDRGHQEGVFR